jgi:hypothetical protein
METPTMTARTTPRLAEPPTFKGRPLHDPSEPVYDQGLAFDIETLLSRRSVLKVIGLGGLGPGLATWRPARRPGPDPVEPAAVALANRQRQ